MAIDIGPEVEDRIRAYPGSITIQVLQTSEHELAATALRRAAHEIAKLDGGWRSAPGLSRQDHNGPKFVSGVLPAGTGPFINIDGGYTPEELLLSIPAIVVRHLTEAGIENAVVTALEGGGTLDALDMLPRAVVLYIYPSAVVGPGNRPVLPEGWLYEALPWVRGDLDEDAELWGAVGSVDFPLRVMHSMAFMEQCQRFRPFSSQVVAGKNPEPIPNGKAQAEGWDYQRIIAEKLQRIGGRIRASNACYRPPHLILAAGGPESSDEELLNSFFDLQVLARRLAPQAAYAFISIDQTFEAFGSYQVPYRWSSIAPRISQDELCDLVAFDAFPYQILGPGHLGRLGAAPEGAGALANGRWEISFGDPVSWLPRLKESGWRMLDPCLLKGYGSALPIREERNGKEGTRRANRLKDSKTARAPLNRQQIEQILTQVGVDADDNSTLLGNEEAFAAFERMLAEDGVHLSEFLELGPVPSFIAAKKSKGLPISPFTENFNRIDRPVQLTLYSEFSEGRTFAEQLGTKAIDKVANWVLEAQGELWATLDQTRFQIDPVEARPFLAHVAGLVSQGSRSGSLTSIDSNGHLRDASGQLRSPPGTWNLVAGQSLYGRDSAPPVPDSDRILAEFESIKEVARDLFPYGRYAFASIGPGGADGPWSWFSQGGEHPILIEPLLDEFVPDAFPYQILGPGHLRRLGGKPDGAIPLGGGKIELSIGDPFDWIPHVKDEGRRVLAACLVSENEMHRIKRERDASKPAS